MSNNTTIEDVIIEILKEDCPWSKLIRFLKYLDGKTNKDLAEILGMTKPVFDSKMHRNSFTYAQISKILDAYGYEFSIKKKEERWKHV